MTDETITLTLTCAQAQTVADFMDYGMDEKSYSVGGETGVVIAEPDDDTFTQSLAMLDPASGWHADDLTQLRDDYQQGLAVIALIMDALHPTPGKETP